MCETLTNSRICMMSDYTLFPIPELPKKEKKQEIHFAKRRVNSPVRNQIIIRHSSLDDMLSEDHRVRAIWDYVQQLDLSQIFAKIQVVEGGVGRSATDPYLLLALWLYATIEGIGSARVIERYCLEHVAFQWLCGEVRVNYHTLSDFRTDHKNELDDLLTQSVAILMKQGLVELKRVAQDGTKVRANAGTSSFRREKTLREYLKEAEDHLASIQREINADPMQHISQIEARRRRTITERKNKAEEAIKELANFRREISENKARYSKKEIEKKVEGARISKTDPEARKMKMANSGFSPAYNVQFATDAGSQVIVGVDVINAGFDYGQIVPMMRQLFKRYGKMASEWLADPGYRKIDDIEKATILNKSCKIYIPLMESQGGKTSTKESTEAQEWRQRMEQKEAKVIYRERAATAECVNAIARNRGLQQFLVRGLRKVQCVALLYAITHNVMRGIGLLGD